MKIKGFRYDGAVFAAVLLTAVGFTGYTALTGQRTLALWEFGAIVVLLAFFLFRALFAKRRYRKMLAAAAKKLDHTDPKVLSSFKYPVCVCDGDSRVTWCNELFANEIAGGDLTQSYSANRFLKGKDPDEGDVCVKVGEKYFSVFCSHFHKNGFNYTVYELIDNTELKSIEAEFYRTRPYSILIEVDNIDDTRSDLKDSEKTQIKSRVEALLDDWGESFNSNVRRISDDRYSVITEKSNVDKMIEDKFSIIDTVRAFEYKDKNAQVTLSVGIAGGSTVQEAEKASRKAFDTALGRGGDQAALRNEDGSYKFFGGVSGSAEKYSKTRARMLAANLAEAIKSSGNVLIMGHANSDFDSLGSAVGVAAVAKSLGVEVNVAINRETSLALPLVDMLSENGESELFVGREQAEKLVGKKTLVVLTDTHVAEMSEFPQIFASAENRIIIDHHRLIAGAADKEIKLFHEPNASSASEMVTEYITYVLDDSKVSKPVAQALLAGIVLDTKSFVLKTGARTFEAAAYLKNRGADPVLVKKLFASSFEINKIKNDTVNSASVYDCYAVSQLTEKTDSARLIAAKAADELLGLEGVKASFVIFELDGFACVSARSFGEINVQLIMEALGGGGHKTMAAARLQSSPENAKQELMKVIFSGS